MTIHKNKYQNPRSAETNTIKSAVQELLQAYKIKDKYTATQVSGAWGKIMGEPIRKRTEQVFMKDKKLFVKLNSAPLKNELSLSKQKIVDLFCKEFGEDVLKEVVFL